MCDQKGHYLGRISFWLEIRHVCIGRVGWGGEGVDKAGALGTRSQIAAHSGLKNLGFILHAVGCPFVYLRL